MLFPSSFDALSICSHTSFILTVQHAACTISINFDSRLWAKRIVHVKYSIQIVPHLAPSTVDTQIHIEWLVACIQPVCFSITSASSVLTPSFRLIVVVPLLVCCSPSQLLIPPAHVFSGLPMSGKTNGKNIHLCRARNVQSETRTGEKKNENNEG